MARCYDCAVARYFDYQGFPSGFETKGPRDSVIPIKGSILA